MDNLPQFKYNVSMVAPSNKLPIKSEPNSTLRTPDGKQEREYDSDGKAKRDTDYGHSQHHPELPSPHHHDWEWDGDVPKRGDAYSTVNWLQIALGVGLVAICATGVILVTMDDAFVVGVADDFLYAPLFAGIGEGFTMIFG